MRAHLLGVILVCWTWTPSCKCQFWGFQSLYPRFPQATPPESLGSGFPHFGYDNEVHHAYENHYDDVVIGAGIIGTWTAYHLASRGRWVLLLDQFPIPHSRGSSTAQTRGLELSNTDESWMPLLLASYPYWRRLEQETGETLFEYHDLLIVTEAARGWPIPVIEDLLKKYSPGTPSRRMSAREVTKQYPDLRYRNLTAGLVDTSGAILLAAKILRILRERIKAYGGEIMDLCRVDRIDPGPPAAVYCHRRDPIFARSVVIAAGPWTSKALKTVGLKVNVPASLGAHAYFPARQGASLQEISLIHYDERQKFLAWTHPEVEYPNLVKVGLALWIPVDPDRRDSHGTGRLRHEASRYVDEHLLCLNSTAAIYEGCIFYHIDDMKHIISRHPQHPNIIIGAVAGSGFKISPVVGQALADLSMGRRPSFDISEFSVNRFL